MPVATVVSVRTVACTDPWSNRRREATHLGASRISSSHHATERPMKSKLYNVFERRQPSIVENQGHQASGGQTASVEPSLQHFLQQQQSVGQQDHASATPGTLKGTLTRWNKRTPNSASAHASSSGHSHGGSAANPSSSCGEGASQQQSASDECLRLQDRYGTCLVIPIRNVHTGGGRPVTSRRSATLIRRRSAQRWAPMHQPPLLRGESFVQQTLPEEPSSSPSFD